LPLLDRQDVLALSHTVDREAELPSLERDTARKLAADGEAGGRTDHDQRVMASVEVLPRNHDHRMRTGLREVCDVDLARLH